MTKTRFLVLLAVLSFGITLGVSAQTATLDLVGVVTVDADIAIQTLPAAGTLDLSTTQTALHVANMTYHSNNAAGFAITVASDNGFALTGDAGLATNNSLAYSLRVGSGPAITANGTVVSASGPQLADVTDALYVAYTGTSSLYADTYRDTLTFSIIAN